MPSPRRKTARKPSPRRRTRCSAQLVVEGKEDAPAPQQGRRSLQASREGRRAQQHPRYRPAHRRARSRHGAADRCRGFRAAAHPWLGAVHPRRDAGAGGHHARHRRGRAICRLARRHLQGDLHAALQLPALLGRRDGPPRRRRAARDRPWQACLARHPSDAAAGRISSPIRSASSRRSPSRTARRRWRRSAAPRCR